MKSTKAFRLVERLDKLLCTNENGDDTVTYVFKGFTGTAGGIGSGGATASVKNTEDQLRAKGLVAGHDYHWVSPFKLTLSRGVIDRDLLDVIQTDSGVESEEELEGGDDSDHEYR